MNIKRMCAVFGIALLLALCIYAHTPLLTVEDNGDGTIFVQGGFSNGASAGGVKIYLTSIATKKVLWESVFPDIGELDVQIPNEPYTVTFDAGPGHVVTKEGPPPPGGFGAAKEKPAEAVSAASDNTDASAPVAAASADTVQIQWTAQDTAAAMPSSGVSYLAIFTTLVCCANLIMLILLLRRKH